MFERFFVRPATAKASSERAVLAAGGSVCSWLPVLDVTPPRPQRAVAARALVLNAIVQLAFRAPTSAVLTWLQTNALDAALSDHERQILATPDGALSEQHLTDLRWRIEALHALMWAGSRVTHLTFASPLDPALAALFPSVREGQPAAPFFSSFQLRPHRELFGTLDLLYRSHWHARDAGLRGVDPGPFNQEVIMERRWALEWVLDRNTDWDDIDLST